MVLACIRLRLALDRMQDVLAIAHWQEQVVKIAVDSLRYIAQTRESPFALFCQSSEIETKIIKDQFFSRHSLSVILSVTPSFYCQHQSQCPLIYPFHCFHRQQSGKGVSNQETRKDAIFKKEESFEVGWILFLVLSNQVQSQKSIAKPFRKETK